MRNRNYIDIIMDQETSASARIEKILSVKNISKKALAKELSVSDSVIYNITSGKNEPSLLLLQKILDRYPEINGLWLFTGKEGKMFNTYNLPGTSGNALMEKSEAYISNNQSTQINRLEKELISSTNKLRKSEIEVKNLKEQNKLLKELNETLKLLNASLNK